MLLVVHPDTQCLQDVTFHVTSHKCSVVLSCVTSLDLCLIQACNNLDSIPSSASLITSKTNYPRKMKCQKNILVAKPKIKMCIQAGSNLPNCYLHKDILLISVLYKKKKKKQARGVPSQCYLYGR